MGVNAKFKDIVKISTYDVVKMKAIAVVWAAWYLFRQLLKNLWTSSAKATSATDGNPPGCLTDASFGQHSYIKIKGVKLHYVDAGPKSKPLLILLHGFPDCWISWRYQIPELAGHFRVVALDLKGFGDSDKPESTYNYQITNIIEEICEFVSILGYRRCTLIGHDIGALIGWFIVHTNPDIVDKFVSISAPHPDFYWDTIPSSYKINSRWVEFCQLPFLPEKSAMDEDLKLLNLLHSHLGKSVEDQSILAAYRYSFSRRDWIGALNYFRVLPFWRLRRKEVYQVAALLIVGNKDNAVQMESIIKSCDYFEKFAIKIVNDAGHYPHQEKALEINQILKNYLIGNRAQPIEKKVQSNGLVNRMFGAVSSTVFDAVQKTTNGITSRALNIGQNT
ncbi:epoxide hydrolase 4-like isoform X2 [Cimex lectularius]|uniref:AB hydrolase-1 domain-containing protein n=1 Tax=Cimex lectularius TaxID=79782 RepID=A0A8I6RAF2_CIMLE|nr:epoxide hydrolase 4-like isoform X2 [Cimex lectularius]